MKKQNLKHNTMSTIGSILFRKNVHVQNEDEDIVE